MVRGKTSADASPSPSPSPNPADGDGEPYLLRVANVWPFFSDFLLNEMTGISVWSTIVCYSNVVIMWFFGLKNTCLKLHSNVRHIRT